MIDSSKDLGRIDAAYPDADGSIIVTDMKGRIISLNKGTVDLLGYSYEDLSGSMIYGLFSKDGVGDNGSLLLKVFEEGNINDRRLTCYKKDGSQIEINFSSSVLTDAQGIPRGTINILRDITHEIRAEDEVREYISQIKEYVMQVEHINALKDLFADILRHDIVNPLTVIKNVSSSLLLNSSLSEDELSKIELIIKNTDKLERIVESATLFGKLENMNDIPVYEEDLWQFLIKARKSLEYMAAEKGVRVTFENTGQKAPSYINPIIEVAFENLLSNAIKYSSEGGLVSARVEDAGDSWLIKVKDRGEGIPEEYKEIIFERFERGGKKGVKGTGLGLAIVRRILELHGGVVWVEDNHPRGSVFCVKLSKN